VQKILITVEYDTIRYDTIDKEKYGSNNDLMVTFKKSVYDTVVWYCTISYNSMWYYEYALTDRHKMMCMMRDRPALSHCLSYEW
jgi:hypothetical protein